VSILLDSSTKYLTYESSHPQWVTSTTYVAGDFVCHTSTFRYSYECITAGGGASTVAPTGTGTTGVLADGYNWTCRQTGPVGGLFNEGFAANGLTIVAWLKRMTDGGAALICRLGTTDGGNNESWKFSHEANDTIFGEKRNASGGTGTASAAAYNVATGWFHAAVTYAANGTNSTYVYTNGIQSAQDTSSRNVLIAPQRIRIGESGAALNDKVAHVAVYKTVLTPTEISTLYQGGHNKSGLSPLAVQAANLKSYWPLCTGDITSCLTSREGFTLVNNGSNATYDADNPIVTAQPDPTIYSRLRAA
jgi:Concanavalin A-like lectin/glucanases superfamily